jgi:hypothetical protein
VTRWRRTLDPRKRPDDLLDVSQIRSGGQRLKCERINLRVVLKHAMDTVESDIGERVHRPGDSVAGHRCCCKPKRVSELYSQNGNPL